MQCAFAMHIVTPPVAADIQRVKAAALQGLVRLIHPRRPLHRQTLIGIAQMRMRSGCTLRLQITIALFQRAAIYREAALAGRTGVK
jgi:hypothetical protein